ncbi:MAG: TonB-dependent receptor [Steroidobacteraceae bacterium]
MLAGLALGLAFASAMAAGDDRIIRFDIPPSSADKVLTQFARQADVQLLFPYEVAAGIELQGLTGDYTASDALQKLISGTCLQAKFSTHGAIQLTTGKKRGFWFMKKNECGSSQVSRSVIATLLGSVALGPAAAQTGPAVISLEEVIVTARKREENLQDIPISIAALSGDLIERQGIDNLRDVGNLIPNLNLSARTDGYPNVTIRGVGGFGNTQGVGFYLDDVQLFSDASSRFGDLDRIEVIKGPQGTLYGGSNIGGAIKYVSKRPDASGAAGSLKLKAGERGIVDIEGNFNAPLGENGWALRGFAFVAEDDGYLTNQNPARVNGVRGTNDPDIGYVDEAGARLAIGGPLSDSLELYASARWNKLEGTGNTWIREVSDDFQYLPIANYSANPTIDRETVAATLELAWELGSVSFLSLSSYTDTDSTRYNDIDAREEFILDSNQPQKMQVFTQEFRLTSNSDGPLNWIVGAYYSLFEESMDSVTIWYDARFDEEGNISGPLGCALGMPTCSGVWAGEAPTPEQEASILPLPFEIRTRDKSSVAFFANLNYDWGDWELDAGVRADTWRNRTNNIDLGIASEKDDLEVMPRLSLSRKWDDGSMLYFTYAEGFEPGGYNMTNFAGDNELSGFDIEKSTSFELGFKTELLDRRLLLNAAAFWIGYDDRQVEYQTQRDNQIIEGIFNLGDSEQYGVELDLLLRATEFLSLSASVGWIDAEWVNGTEIDILTSVVDLSGKTPPNTSDLSWSLALDYERPLAGWDGISLFGGLQVSRTGEFLGLQVWDPVRNPAYTVVNLQAGLRSDRWEFALQVENLGDEDYYTDVQRFPNLYVIDGLESVNIGTLAPPRTVTASLKYSF